MYNVAEVTRWLEAHGEPRRADDAHAVAAYRKFYSLDFHGVGHEMGRLEVDGEQICVQRFTPLHHEIRGAAFVLHGYLDHTGLQHKTIGRLLREGYQVVAYDQPGHGLSTGPRASIESFEHYVACLAACVSYFENASDATLVVGHSMGGAVSMTYLLQHPGRMQKAVLVAPLYHPRSWRAIRVAHFVGRHFVKKQPRRFIRNTQDEAFFEFIQSVDPLSPRSVPMRWVTSMFDWTKLFAGLPPCHTDTLILQGTEDGTVDWRGNIEVIRKKFTRARIHLVPGAGHHLMNEIETFSEQAWDAVTPFLRER